MFPCTAEASKSKGLTLRCIPNRYTQKLAQRAEVKIVEVKRVMQPNLLNQFCKEERPNTAPKVHYKSAWKKCVPLSFLMPINSWRVTYSIWKHIHVPCLASI